MSTHQDPTEQLLDLLVYAPLGLLLEARDLVPKLAEKGRQRMGGQVTVARMIGEMAVKQGQRRAEKVVTRIREQQTPAAAARAGGTNGHPPAGSLAIPGYDTLSASQVLPRLEGLSVEQLRAVQAYEEATRARKTVLTRIDQLRGSAA